MNDWLTHKDKFLREMMRLEGLRGFLPVCAKCAATGGIVRCTDCSGSLLLCRRCCLDAHISLPFHVIKVSTSPI